MEDNPYSALVGALRTDTDSRIQDTWTLGKVQSVQPLVVEIGGQLMRGKDLLVNVQLLENHEPVKLAGIQGVLNGVVDCGAGEVQIQVTDGHVQANGTFGGILQPGDRVVALPDREAQVFIIACKVVQVPG